MDIIKNASETIFQRLAWHTAKRDQAGITEELANEQEIHKIYGLGDAGLFNQAHVAQGRKLRLSGRMQ